MPGVGDCQWIDSARKSGDADPSLSPRDVGPPHRGPTSDARLRTRGRGSPRRPGTTRPTQRSGRRPRPPRAAGATLFAMPPARLPDGDPAPADGALPEAARAELGERAFGVYVHVPFCATRCGYCDFNTYTASELTGGNSRDGYTAAALAEIALARRVLGEGAPAVETVFFGGGTPTLLAPDQLAAILHAIDDEFGLAPGAEITTEANPDSVGPAELAALRDAGFTRVSL